MSSYLPQPPPAGGGWSPVGPYATSSMPMPPMRSLRGLSVALTVLFLLIALAEVVAAGALYARAGLFDDVVAGRTITFEQGDSADNKVAAGLLSHGALFIAIAVVFIIWQYRHAKNAEVLGARGGLGPGWAIGGWFIPLANYVLPAVQLHQSSRASDVAGRRQGGSGKGSGIVILWAIVLGIAAVTFVVGGGLAPNDGNGDFQITTNQDFRDAASGDRTAGTAMILYVAAAGIALVMVRRLSRRQTEAYAAVRAASPAGDGPPSSAVPSWDASPPPAPPPPPLAAPPIPPPPGAPPPPL